MHRSGLVREERYPDKGEYLDRIVLEAVAAKGGSK
jgi:hypothetical protein